VAADDRRYGEADEVRVVHVADADVAAINGALDAGWRLLACGVAERREVTAAGAVCSAPRCTFILGRSRGEQVLAEAVPSPVGEEAGERPREGSPAAGFPVSGEDMAH